MSLFKFNFRPKSQNQFNDNKENVLNTLTPFSMRSDTSIGSKEAIFGFNLTPPQRSVFGNQTNDSVKSQKCLETVSEKKKVSQVLTIDSTVQQISEDSNKMKHKIVAELERIETFKTITEMEISRQSEEIKNLKEINADLENRLTAMRRENSELVVKLNVETNERQGVLTRMNTTREMFHELSQSFQRIENRLDALDDVKDAFDLVNESRCQQINELNQRFLDIESKHITIVSKLESEITQKNTEWNVVNEALDRTAYDLELHKTESTKQFDNFVEELNKQIEVKQSLELALNQEEIKNKALAQKLIEMEERHQSLLISGQKKDEEFEKIQNHFETKTKEFETKIGSLLEKESDLLKRIDELKEQISSNEQKNLDFEIEIEKKNHSIVDLEQVIKDKVQEIVDLLSEKTNLLQMNDELNSKVMSIENQRQDSETSFQTEKHSIISDFEKTIKEMESNVESLREEKNQLIKWKEENLILIDDLESKANQSIIEKEAIEQQLKSDLNDLKDELNDKMNDFTAKIEDLEKRIHDLTALKQQNETTINDMLSEKEVLKIEREDLKQKLEKEERSLENQMSHMRVILESCKSDYNKRIEDKEERIKEYRRENERMRISIDRLTKKCERLEAEKQSTNSKLQELTLSTLRPTTSSPSRVLTPKFMSPVESTRISANRSGSPLVKALNYSPKLESDEHLVLSAKQELQQKVQKSQKSQNSQSSQTSKKVLPLLPQIDIKSKTKNDSKQMVSNKREIKRLAKLNDSNSSESVYELIEEKHLKSKKAIRKEKDFPKHRIESPVRVSMSGVDPKQKKNSDTEIDEYEYDIEKLDTDQPNKKKMKTVAINLKTYGKKGMRVENIMKGRPTPTKDNDLSWLNF